MPQSTNLNVSPYYDDYNEEENYYRVLFKPGVSVQTRELNNLQSILQNQIERFGSKFFSNGGIVVPGNFAYDGSFTCIEIETNYKGVSVETYFKNFIGKTLRGRESGVTARVEYTLSATESISSRNTTALYVKYQKSSSEDFTTEIFKDGEELITEDDVVVGSTLFSKETVVFRVLSPSGRSASSVGSSAKIESGIYFIRGNFVNISKGLIILDPYTNTPSYRVGLQITESIIDSDEDSNLVDNARGFSNYAAPGADRLKIEASLTKKGIDDYNDDDFIELFRVENGVVRKIDQNDPYAFITDILARRTYDESGNYYVQPYKVSALESLNDNLGNGGQYLSTQNTNGGLVPSDDLAVLKVSPGKAYVKGYEVPTTTELLDYPKPRTTKSVESSSSNFRAGNTLRLNNLTGVPKIGITTDSSLALYKMRLNSSNLPYANTQIGVARVYDFEYHNNSYENQSSQSNLNLFDIQTYTEITVNSSITGISTGDYFKGQYSNASGYVKDYTGNDIILYQVSGNFVVNEPLIICGINTITSISAITDYAIQDIKSVSNSDLSFTADTLLDVSINIEGPFNIDVDTTVADISRQDGTSFASGLKVGDIISYSREGGTLPVYARINSISNNLDSIEIVQIDSVSNVCTNVLGTSGVLSSISAIRPQIRNYNDSEFYAPLENSSISEVSFLNSSIFVKKYYEGLAVSSNGLTLPTLVNTDFVYSQFDEERYCLVNSDTNTNITITEDNFSLSTGGKDASFVNLPIESANVTLITTQIKSNISSKYKKLQKCAAIGISSSKYESPSNGLTYSRVYGTRVEDQEISLNYPDIFEVHGVFQSTTTSDPQLPEITISGLDTADVVVGEIFIGQSSGAVAICVDKPSSSTISFIYKSENTFAFEETIKFNDSESQATIINIIKGEENILSEFLIDNGQRKYFYDIGRLIRKDSSKEPSYKLKIIFDYFKFEDTDLGDIISVNSYPADLYGNKISSLNGVRNTDAIDIRPRVSDYNPSSGVSPFDYASRSFALAYNNSSQILKSNESIVFDYSFYLPRTDKLTLDKSGNFKITFGEPAEIPTVPQISEEVLDVATIFSSAYVFNTSEDIKIELVDHRRYTMSDIRGIEKRVENLEFYTSLSLLEIATQNLTIEDSYGFNRFKCGFFVDNFSSYNVADESDPLFNANISNNSLSPEIERTQVNLKTTTTTNLRVTGNSITLNYSEVEYQKQPFASRMVNINPFNILTWSGNLQLRPESDRWKTKIVDEVRVSRADLRFGADVPETTREVSRIRYIRSRNIEFTATRLKPNTQFDFLFDQKNLSDKSLGNTYAFPKLIEVTNVNGTFIIGETVRGYRKNNKTKIKFRLCQPNHKTGPYNAPESIYSVNPYNPNTSIPQLYGPESTVLNVDTQSLNVRGEGKFFGNITEGMILYGTESGAFATVSSVRLVSDEKGSVIGSFFIPKPKKGRVKFETGNTTATITTTEPPLGVPGEIISRAESNFVSEGKEVKVTKITYYDPLAQTFNVSEDQGVFITSVDVFFATKDPTIPVELQIREVSSGIPGGPDKVVDSMRKVLNSSEVLTSLDGSVATRFTFENLTRLEGGREYAVVLISDSDFYQVWVSRMGEVEISTSNLPEVQKVIISKQPSLGTLFKSQNGTTWVPTPEEDLKFTLNRAEFSPTSGTAFLSNPDSPVESLDNKLPENPITTLSTSTSSPYNSGRHIRITHPNHGMYSENNFVQISGVEPDGLPVSLTQELDVSSNGPINISSDIVFTSFNGSAVDAVNNPGYVKIGEEIIKYTSASGGQLTGITRGQFGTTPMTHLVNSEVYRYEFNGVSLAAINTVFEGIIDPSIDHYYVQIGSNNPTFASDKFGGGEDVYATHNVQFSSLELDEDFIRNYQPTSVLATVRTVSSTSVDGTEVSFADNGYQSIGISSISRFETPRMICSDLNEDEYLPQSQFIDSKSFTLELNLNTSNTHISPIINLNNTNVFFENYIINQPIDASSYPTDPRINSNINDPNSFIYVSKRVDLTNSATSLKVLLSAYRHSSSDIRVLYKIFKNDVPDEDQVWELFPGYLNLNDGRPDEYVSESLIDEFKDYTFSIDNIPQFTSFAIKIVGTTTNQSYSPIIKDLRAIAIK